MSLAEAIPQYGEASTRGLDRTPPQDMTAEQCVLGAMMLSKDAIADVVEILKSHDFYRPNHSTVFDTVLELYGRGEKVCSTSPDYCSYRREADNSTITTARLLEAVERQLVGHGGSGAGTKASGPDPRS